MENPRLISTVNHAAEPLGIPFVSHVQRGLVLDMTFIILFEDAADADPDIRKAHMPAHLAFLEENASKIRAAGPLADADGNGRGGLWIVEAGSSAEVERLVHDDPFWPTGLRKSHTILEWKRVYADGQRLIHPH